ncbi:DUF481 domain-containing protein [Fulvivirga sedimenti]|uniref:DUF481 domain-containing protein n=1 Tax=Fulvivirga sedimenti TaxID=2879465 RepID=A0A9X1HQH1_9BACT|nr:DUF481 domain-containing protein [Fulvivirga sedimenti]MCA6074459.1 DUF481 domain-containing protein [Fulvivirga sedimenti]
MKGRSFFVLVVLLMLFGSAAGQKKDTVFLYHGQMLLGEILSVAEGRVQLDSDDAGVVKIKYYKVKTFHAGLHFYRIRTTDEQILYGRVRSSTNEGFIKVENLGVTLEIPIESIVRLQQYEDSFKERISGTVSAGYDYTRSSNIGRINFDLGMKYLAQDLELNLNSSTIMTQEGGSLSRDIENVTLSAGYFLNYSWIIATRLTYQRNLELSLKRRFQEFAGAGYLLVQKTNRQLMAVTGVALNQELSTEGVESGTLLEIPLIFNFNFYQFQSPNLQLDLNQNIYFGITQSGRIRNDGNIRLSWEPISDFVIGLNFYSNYDNQPPEGESERNFDFGTVLSLGYKFD